MGTRRHSTTLRLARLCPLVLAVVAATAGAGCAAETDDPGSADSAATRQPDATGAPSAAEPRNAAYDAAARKAKITNKATPGEAVSAETTLLGYIQTASVEEVQDKLLGVRRWPDIKADDGGRVFTASRVVSDDHGEAKRTIMANVTLEGNISLDTKVLSEARPEGTGRKVSITNTSTYTYFFSDVLLPGKLTIDLQLIPYQGGVIVDGRARVKLNASEESAPSITGYVVPIFNWLKAE
jgi:hypothetical protein